MRPEFFRDSERVTDQDDGTLLLVVQHAVEGMVESLVGRPRWVCDKASAGFSGLSMMIMSAPHPVSTRPTEVASRQPCAVVSNSGTACRSSDSRVGKIRRYQSLATIRRQSTRRSSVRRAGGSVSRANPGSTRP